MTRLLPVCFLCVCSFALKANASSFLSIQGLASTAGGAFAINQTANPADASMQLSGTTTSTNQTGTIPTSPFETSQITLRAAFGDFGASGSVETFCAGRRRFALRRHRIRARAG